MFPSCCLHCSVFLRQAQTATDTSSFHHSFNPPSRGGEKNNQSWQEIKHTAAAATGEQWQKQEIGRKFDWRHVTCGCQIFSLPSPKKSIHVIPVAPQPFQCSWKFESHDHGRKHAAPPPTGVLDIEQTEFEILWDFSLPVEGRKWKWKFKTDSKGLSSCPQRKPQWGGWQMGRLSGCYRTRKMTLQSYLLVSPGSAGLFAYRGV